MANAITCGAPLHLPSGVNWDGLIPYRQSRTKTCGFPLTVPSELFGMRFGIPLYRDIYR